MLFKNLKKLEQGTGRGVRHANDYCFVLFCDNRYDPNYKYRDKIDLKNLLNIKKI